MRKYTNQENRLFLLRTVLWDRLEDILRGNGEKRKELFIAQVSRIYWAEPIQEDKNERS